MLKSLFKYAYSTLTKVVNNFLAVQDNLTFLLNIVFPRSHLTTISISHYRADAAAPVTTVLVYTILLKEFLAHRPM